MDFFRFLKQIPGLYRLYKHYGYSPNDLQYILGSFHRIIWTCTGGKLSKLMYDPAFVIDEIREYYEEES